MGTLNWLEILDWLAKAAIVIAAIRAAFAVGGWKQVTQTLAETVKKHDEQIQEVSKSLSHVAGVVEQHDKWILQQQSRHK